MQTKLGVRASDDFSPNLFIEVADGALGRLGYVVIDRAVNGTTSGGVRFAPDVSAAELADLARSMTYKWAFLNVPMGGAKAGIFADPDQLGCERAVLMEAFGRAIGPLVRRQVYYPGVDMGTSLEDLRAIMRGAGRPLVEQQIDGSFCTALTVFETIRQVASFNHVELTGLRVAIEGFGKVGSALAELLAQAGAQLVALSTVQGALVAQAGLDVARLLSLRQQHGDQLVDYYPDAQPIAPSALFAQAVDVLVPGARPRAIHSGNADQVQARWIVPISSVPVALDAERMLIARGVMLMPDFVANCGGVLASNMLANGFDVEDVRHVVEVIFARVVTSMLQKAECQVRPVGEIARAVAWENHDALNAVGAGVSRKLVRMSRLLQNQGLKGVWRRFAWRAHRRWPGANAIVRQSAVEQFAEWGLGVTLGRVVSS